MGRTRPHRARTDASVATTRADEQYPSDDMTLDHDLRRRDYSTPAELSAVLARAERALSLGSVERLEGPPTEVLREMLAAERAWQNLAAQGRAVRFGTGADGRVSIELTDSDGHALDELGPIGLFRLLKTAS